MSDALDGIGWLTTAANWWGSRGILHRLVQHLWYSGFSTALAVIAGLPLGLAIGHSGRGKFLAAGAANALRAVPTFGVVTLLFIWRPLSLYPVLVSLTVLAIPPIVLSAAAGIESVDADTRDAARGVGLSPMQVLFQVEIPCALPLILAGIRSAANQVIATATVAGFGIGLGGLGLFIYSGYGRQRYDIVYGATIIVILLVLVVEGLFAIAQHVLVSPGIRSRRVRRIAVGPPTLARIVNPSGGS